MNSSVQKLKIVILGSGNVATHLALALQQNGFEIIQIFGRNAATAVELSQQLNNCLAVTDIRDMTKTADLYILALSDDGVITLANDLYLGDKMVVHCAGSLPMDILKKVSTNYGVLYPLYTFSKNIPVCFNKVPVCIEASNEATADKLMAIAQSLSAKTTWIDSEKRKMIHLAAVFVSNFTNLLNTVAYEIMASKEIDFSLLSPLIQETLRKTEKGNPFQSQTGPAIRNDQTVIQMQLKLLNDFPLYQKLYQELTHVIQEKVLNK